MLPLRARLEQGIMGYSTFPKTLRLEPHHQIQFSFIPIPIIYRGSYLFVEGQSASSTAPADWKRKSEWIVWHKDDFLSLSYKDDFTYKILRVWPPKLIEWSNKKLPLLIMCKRQTKWEFGLDEYEWRIFGGLYW